MEEVFAVMRKGYADTIVGHECVLNIFLAENEGRYRKLETLLGTAELGVAFQKGTHEKLARRWSRRWLKWRRTARWRRF